MVMAETAVTTQPKAGFQPGNKLGHGTRPSVARHVTELARVYTCQAVETLASIMLDTEINASARVKAAEVLLDRGYGKAPITYDIVHTLNDKELQETAYRILQKRRVIDAEVVTSDTKALPSAVCRCNIKHHGNRRVCEHCQRPVTPRG